MKSYVINSLYIVLLLSLVGCSSTKLSYEEPITIEAIKHRAKRSLENDCLHNILFNKATNYPLTNYGTYRTWVLERGNRGPSPEEWCRKHARDRVT
tara:strand:- start:252 stop:539 length:288 start_codon:yes stop_codon:yes gene_type:complete